LSSRRERSRSETASSADEAQPREPELIVVVLQSADDPDAGSIVLFLLAQPLPIVILIPLLSN
jgi:hypothetical protein